MNKYQKLQAVIVQQRSLWRKPFWQWKDVNFYADEFWLFCDILVTYISYHELFSIESWLMESIQRKPIEWMPKLLEWSKYPYHRRYQEMNIMTADKKIDYFLKNITDG